MGMSFSLLLLLGRACTTKAFVNRGRPLSGMSSRVAGPLLSQRFAHSDVKQVDTPRVHRLLQPSTFGSELHVVFNHPLGLALHKLPKVFFAKTALYCFKFPLKRADGREGDFGTSFKPNVTAILAAAAPSPIGKELTTETISIPEVDMIRSCQKWIAEKLFPEVKGVTLRFHKMAIHEAGGHFDFHRDTTHADNHHATLLLGVKSAHKGGALTFEIEGAEVKGVDFSESDPYKLAAVAFYTDVRHKVEPVTEGTRIVLQYDVLVEKDKDKDFEKEEEDMREPYLEHTNTVDNYFPADPSKLDDVLSVLKDTFEDIEAAASKKSNECPKYVALPLFHLYRKVSILPAYLKGVDSELFHALLKTGLYDVALSPIVIKSETDNDGSFTEKGYSASLVDPVDKICTGESTHGQVDEVAVGSDHMYNTHKAQYIVSKRESTYEFENIEYIENEETGDAVRRGMAKHYLSAMLVSKKT